MIRSPTCIGSLALLGLLVPLGCLAGCGGGGATAAGSAPQNRSSSTPAVHTTSRPKAKSRPVPPPRAFAHVLPTATATTPTAVRPVATYRGRVAAWVARSASGVTLLGFDQGLVDLHLHSGTTDAGASGWRYGPLVAGAEAHHLLAAFNGGFRLSTGAGGFFSYGRAAVPLRVGLGSIVTYMNGRTDIGDWGTEVPARGLKVASVRQNLTPLIDHGRVATSTACLSCWGAVLGGVSDPARSALGITADGRLIWAGGEHLTVDALAHALRSRGVVRAVELDINPEWVAAYLYGHRGGHGPLAPIPAVAGQTGIPGQYLSAWSRDFFTITTP